MRVTQSMLYRQTLDTMQQRESNALKRQNEIVSGVRLNQAMDDPAAMGRVMRNDNQAQQLQRFSDNIRNVESRLGFLESEMDGVTDLLHRGHELMLTGANGSQSPESLEALAVELRSLGESMLQVGNGRDGQGRYLFGGHNDGARPFDDSGASVSYNGAASARQIPIDEATFMANGLVGDEVFLNGPGGDLFALFNDLADTLQQPMPDAASRAARQADIETGLNRLDAGLNHVLDIRAGLGINLQRASAAQDRLEVLDIELAKDSSSLRDTDLADAVSVLTQEMSTLEAARKTFAQIQGLSLFNFIR